MLKDTFEKVNKYRDNVQTMLNIVLALKYCMLKFLEKTSQTKPVKLSPEIRSKRLVISREQSSISYFDRATSTLHFIPNSIDELSAGNRLSIDQLFDIITHLDEEMTDLFKVLTEEFTAEAAKVIEEFKDAALPDLM